MRGLDQGSACRAWTLTHVRVQEEGEEGHGPVAWFAWLVAALAGPPGQPAILVLAAMVRGVMRAEMDTYA